MKLSILIPTYNRAKFLIKNLTILANFIIDNKNTNNVEIVVTNNCSSDNTDELMNRFIISNSKIKINYFSNEENIGLEKNALFSLSKAKGEFVMYLGDDDYLDYKYFTEAINHLETHKNTSVILPNLLPINLKEEILGKTRDENDKTTLYKVGFKNCLLNSWRGHQLSGLILRRENLLEDYYKLKISNIYPFIFFVSYLCLKGDTYHITDYPVKVTEPGQEKKNWGYGEDGLINEVFDNYKKLPLTIIQKTRLQLHFYKVQSWRLRMYFKKGIKSFLIAFKNIWLSKNATLFFKLAFPFKVVTVYLYFKFKALTGKL